MKSIITSSGSNIESLFDKRFGRSQWYCIYNEDTGHTEFIKNNNVKVLEGAGKLAVEKARELGVQKIISGDFGVKTQKLLEREGIQMVIIPDNNFTVADIIKMIK